jgi:hypothetical protein
MQTDPKVTTRRIEMYHFHETVDASFDEPLYRETSRLELLADRFAAEEPYSPRPVMSRDFRSVAGP